MANPEKGELSFEVQGEQYTLHYSTNAVSELEDAVGKTAMQIQKEVQSWKTKPEKFSISLLRKMFWAGLQDHHSLSLKEAGNLFDAAGGVVVVFGLITGALARSQPDAGETKGAHPRKRR
jgi:uncharacterized protein YxjI